MVPFKIVILIFSFRPFCYTRMQLSLPVWNCMEVLDIEMVDVWLSQQYLCLVSVSESGT